MNFSTEPETPIMTPVRQVRVRTAIRSDHRSYRLKKYGGFQPVCHDSVARNGADFRARSEPVTDAQPTQNRHRTGDTERVAAGVLRLALYALIAFALIVVLALVVAS